MDAQMDAEQATQTIGSRVDDFALPDLSGRAQTLRSHLGDRSGIVVVFWSGVCSHCVRYDEYLNRFERDHPEISLLAVASRQEEGAAQLRATVAERGLEFALLHDPDRAVARGWLVEQTPRVFLLDRGLQLLYRGAFDNFKYPDDPEHEPHLENAIAAFLAGRPVPRAETPSFGCPIQSVYYTMPRPLRS